MHDWQSLTHVRWDCKYHVVIVPQYRKKRLYGKFRKSVGQIIGELCQQKRVELVEGHLMPDHIHMLSMTTLIEPPMIAVMAPVENGEKVVLGSVPN